MTISWERDWLTILIRCRKRSSQEPCWRYFDWFILVMLTSWRMNPLDSIQKSQSQERGLGMNWLMPSTMYDVYGENGVMHSIQRRIHCLRGRTNFIAVFLRSSTTTRRRSARLPWRNWRWSTRIQSTIYWTFQTSWLIISQTALFNDTSSFLYVVSRMLIA